MATELRLRGGTTAQHATFTGAEKEVTVDIDKNTLVVHDGVLQGGYPVALYEDLQAVNVDYNNTSSGLIANDVQAAIDELADNFDDDVSVQQWTGYAVGDTIALTTNVPEPPTDDSRFRYIKLSAGEDGVGQYNEGVLGSESISGTAPLLEATAQITDSGSPKNLDTIHLLNTEGAFIRPGEAAGVAQFDQMQRITGQLEGTLSSGIRPDAHVSGGALKVVSLQDIFNVRPAWSENQNGAIHGFDSFDSPDARASDTTDGETRPRNETRVYYMRIR